MPCSVVPVSEMWKRFVVDIEAGSAPLESLGSVRVFCMSTCTGLAG